MSECFAIRLRKLTIEDVRQARYLAWLSDPEVTRYMVVGRTPQDLSTVTAYFESHQWPAFLFLAIETPAGQHIGNRTLGPIGWTDKQAEIGIMIGEKKEWGKGVGTEAVHLICRHAFERLGLEKLTTGFVAENLGSGKVFFKNGFQIEGIYRKHFWLEGCLRDVIRVARFQESEGEIGELSSSGLWQYWQTAYENPTSNGARRYNLGSCPPRGRGYTF